MTKFLSNYDDALEDTITNMKSLKLEIYPGENVADLCAAILVDAETLESAGAFKPEQLGYITCIFEDSYESRFRMYAIQKYKEFTGLIKKLPVCDMDVISHKDLITYKSLVQEATWEYRDLVDSKRWEPSDSKEKSQDQPSIPKAYTVLIYQSINNTLKQVDFKSHRSGNGSGSGRGSSSRSDMNFQKCGKKGHIHKYRRSKVNGSSGNPPKNYTNDLP